VQPHLLALVPGQGAAQLLGQGEHVVGERLHHRFGLDAADFDQQQEPAPPLDQGGDRGAVLAQQQVAFPVAGDRSVLGFGGALADVHHAHQLAAAAATFAVLLGSADRSAGAQMPGQFLTQRATGMHLQAPVDGLVGHLQLRVVGEGDRQPPGDLLR
jgi:hypothetical protein